VALRPPGFFAFSRSKRVMALCVALQCRIWPAREHHMTLLNKVFTTRTLLQIIFVLAATVVMKAVSLHYDFSWASALAAG
jgi:hypothetical protein